MISGEEIRLGRQRLGLSPDAFGEAIGVDRRTVSNWESGKTSPSRYEGKIRALLDERGPGLRTASDAELVAEIARRLSKLGPMDISHRPATITDDTSQTHRSEFELAARRGENQGKQIRHQLDELGEESQDQGADE